MQGLTESTGQWRQKDESHATRTQDMRKTHGVKARTVRETVGSARFNSGGCLLVPKGQEAGGNRSNGPPQPLQQQHKSAPVCMRW